MLPYDQLVLACGMTVNVNALPGMAEHALPLRTVGDALFLRNRLLVRMEQAEMQDDPERRRWLTTFIVVGGGLSGVEVAGELSDFVLASRRYYPNIDARDCKVILLHNEDRILPELDARLADFALTKMQHRGIDFRLNTLVARADDRGVELRSGARIDGGTVICAVGTAPTELVNKLPLPKQRGRIETAPDMLVPGYPGVWALGDCAAVINAHDGRLSPPTAQFATRQAEQLAENLLRGLRGDPARPFSYQSRGQFSTIGHQRAVAEIFGLRLSGLMPWILRRGVYLANFPTFARKVRVLFEWIWTCLFPPDRTSPISAFPARSWPNLPAHRSLDKAAAKAWTLSARKRQTHPMQRDRTAVLDHLKPGVGDHRRSFSSPNGLRAKGRSPSALP